MRDGHIIIDKTALGDLMKWWRPSGGKVEVFPPEQEELAARVRRLETRLDILEPRADKALAAQETALSAVRELRRRFDKLAAQLIEIAERIRGIGTRN